MFKQKIPRRLFYFFLFLLFLYLVILNASYLAQRAYPLPYRQVIMAEARRNDLEPLLVVAVIYVESGFDAKALSSKGARGLMQVMPETGKWVATQQLGLDNFTAEQLFEPRINVAIGTRYLCDLLR